MHVHASGQWRDATPTDADALIGESRTTDLGAHEVERALLKLRTHSLSCKLKAFLEGSWI